MLCLCKTSSKAFGMSASIAIVQCPLGTGAPCGGAACIAELKTRVALVTLPSDMTRQ